jgi:hypothetical protein
MLMPNYESVMKTVEIKKENKVPIKYRNPVSYMTALRPLAPNGTSLLAGENNAIFIQFPNFMELPDLMISLLEQEQYVWKWISIGNDQKYSGEIKYVSLDDDEADEKNEEKEKDEKNEEKEKEKDEGIKQTEKEFDNMATYVANTFWKQARKQMRFGGVTK